MLKVNQSEQNTKNYAALFAGLIFMVGTLCLWQAFLKNESEKIFETTQSQGMALRKQINDDLDDRVQSIQRMARRLEFDGKLSQNEWAADAKAHLEDFRDYRALSVVDKNYTLKWTYPLAGREKLIGLSLRKEPDREATFDTARDSRSASISPDVHFRTGGHGTLIAAPYFPHGKFAGFMVGAINTDAFFQGELTVKGYAILIRENDKTIFSNFSNHTEKEITALDKKWGVTTNLDYRSIRWEIRLIPTPEKLRSSESRLPLAVLFTGFIIAFLFAAMVQFALTARESTRQMRQANAELEIEKQKANEATQAKSQFLANISHEIRTPLNGVTGIAELLLQTPLNAEQEELSSTIRNSAQLLLALVNDVLDFSKIEAGKMNLEKIDFSLESIVQSLEKTLGFTARQKGLQFTQAISDDLRRTVFMGDPTRLGQVLLNLLNNAIKFTPRGSIHLHVRSEPHDGNLHLLRFEITDTGVGIPEAALPRLFQPFTQADSSTTRRFGGTGLGLSISKFLVQLMGGEIGVTSRDGAGSTFWFTILIEKAPVRASVKSVGASVPTLYDPKEIHLLLAEDNLVNQTIAIRMLQSRRYQVDAVLNGVEALKALDAKYYHCILMDCQMPELDGYETTRQIRKSTDNHNRNIPIIALTANAMEGDREKCLEAGMNEYLSKPFKVDALVGKIEEQLNQTYFQDKRQSR